MHRPHPIPGALRSKNGVESRARAETSAILGLFASVSKCVPSPAFGYHTRARVGVSNAGPRSVMAWLVFADCATERSGNAKSRVGRVDWAVAVRCRNQNEIKHKQFSGLTRLFLSTQFKHSSF